MKRKFYGIATRGYRETSDTCSFTITVVVFDSSCLPASLCQIPWWSYLYFTAMIDLKHGPECNFIEIIVHSTDELC